MVNQVQLITLQITEWNQNVLKTAEGKVYQLVPESTEGKETGEVVAGETKEVTYVYKEVKGNVVVKYEDLKVTHLTEDEKDETDASTKR